ncbi:MAG: MFS transporter [Phycisphaerales bacterium]|nr:MFS transporter [Phycisphaerales bacterium]
MAEIPTPPADVKTAGRISLAIAFGMLFMSAIPDATVVPVLKGLLVDRYGVEPGPAHAFMAVNLLGALCSAPLASVLRRRVGQRTTIAFAAVMNGILLALMALPIGFWPTLALRTVEGAMDLIVYAVLFAAVGDAGSAARRGSRMGAAATAMMLGISCGLGLGGVIGQHNATYSLWMGAAACVIVGVMAVRVVSTNRQASVRNVEPPDRNRGDRQPLWPVLMMMFSDRCLSSLLVTTVPLYLTIQIRMDEQTAAGMIGVAMLLLALGAWPAGRLADRHGPLALRVMAGLMFASMFTVLPFVARAPMLMLGVMAGLGLSGAALFACSLELVHRSGRGVAGMHLLHAAGNAGFFVGPVVAGTVLTFWPSYTAESALQGYIVVMFGFALLHVLATGVSTASLWLDSRPA